MKYRILFLLLLLLPLAHAATLTGSIYNADLRLEQDVLVEINTTPTQKLLSKAGSYSFELSPGHYTLNARKGSVEIQEKISIQEEGKFIYDLFLLESLDDESDLWQDSEQQLFEEEQVQNSWWTYALAVLIIAFLIYRVFKYKKKYGSVKQFRNRIKKESTKSVEQHKQELEQEPSYLENALEIIKKHDGRISQKQLRKEMLYLSEAKVSLILTELEHKGKIEKVKKGRGNVILLK